MHVLRQAFRDNTEPDLIQAGTKFRFANYEGEVSLVDGLAAGNAWCQFKFHSGELDGKVLWCKGWDPNEGYTYEVDVLEDGYLINYDPAVSMIEETGTRYDGDAREDLDDVGGDYAPEYDGFTFHLGA